MLCIFIVAVFMVFINRINKNEKGIPDRTGSSNLRPEEAALIIKNKFSLI